MPRLDAGTLTGVSVASWLDDLGLRGTPRLLLEAYLRLATYIDAPDLLDAGAAVANLQLAIGAGVRYLDGGWQSIVDALVATGGFEVRALEARSVDPARDNETVVVDTTAGCLPACPVGRRGLRHPDRGGHAARRARTRAPTPTARRTGGDRRLLGARGCAAPPGRSFVIGGDEATYLSTHAPAARLAPPGHALVHVLRYHPGGVPAAPDTDADRAALWRTAAAAGVARDDVVVERFLGRMAVSGSVPTAGAGGLAGGGRPTVAHDARPGVFLAGDWVGPCGLLADAAISSGQHAGQQAVERSGTMSVS